MKIKVRKSVFETNSSSMHSLVVKKEDGYYTEEELREDLYINNDGEWDLSWGDELCFGRSPFGVLTTFESKTRYAIASICCYSQYTITDNIDKSKDNFDKIKEMFIKYIPECKKIELRKNTDFPYGWVDENILTGFLEENQITLEEFLTNKKYVVIVDGDEYCIWDSLKESGLVDLNQIEKEYN